MVGPTGRVDDPESLDPGQMGLMTSETRGESHGRLRLAAIKDAPSSLPLPSGSDATLFDRQLHFFLTVGLPGERPFVPLHLLLDAVLLAASIKDAPPLSLLPRRDDTLCYADFGDSIKEDVEDQIDLVRKTVIAAGAKLEPGDMEKFLGETLSGFNRIQYIHTKFMLVDPLGNDPVVVTGSANLSQASQVANDENMLVIRGNTRVADIYFGAFTRIFGHLYSRYIGGKMKKLGSSDPDAGFLKEKVKDRVPQHFKKGLEQLRRFYFMGG